MIRLFIAINLPADIRSAIYDDTSPLRASVNAVKWVSAPSLHVTVKFLGEQEDRLVGELGHALETVAARHASLRVRTTEFGAFPNFRRPRVVWVGMTGAEALGALAHDVDVAVAGFGVPIETRPFRAHLTIGRVKRELSPIEAAALGAAARARGPAREFSIRTIDLMQSELGPGGSRYSVLAAVPLHARGT
jgi:RNA 2',3'-cyclic 3'-phosphodiesterase